MTQFGSSTTVGAQERVAIAGSVMLLPVVHTQRTIEEGARYHG